jgi:dCTP deaminase
MSLLSDRDLTHALARGEECYNKWLDSEKLRLYPADSASLAMPQPGFLPGEALWCDLWHDASDMVQPASIDLCLGGQFRYWPHPTEEWREANHWPNLPVIDPLSPGLHPPGGLPILTAQLDRLGDTFDVQPGAFVLAHTIETVGFGPCLAGQVYGKSSIGRIGLEVENAGYIDPGFIGQITLELKNTTAYVIRLTVGMPIAQMAVHRLSSPAVRSYGHPDRSSRYMGQMGATPSRYALGRTPAVSEVEHA